MSMTSSSLDTRHVRHRLSGWLNDGGAFPLLPDGCHHRYKTQKQGALT